jgi:PAS domain S-box-containing protein
MKSPLSKKIILLFFIVILGIFVSVFIITEKNKLGMQKSNKWVEHTHQVFAKSSLLESTIQYNILANYGYRISGDPFFIRDPQLTYNEVKKQLDGLSILISDNDKQIVRIKYLNKLVDSRILFLKEGNQLQYKKGIELSRNLAFLDNTIGYLNEVKAVIVAIQLEESRLLKLRQQAYSDSSIAFYFSFYLLLSFVIVLMIFMFFLVMYNMKEKEKIRDVLLAKNEWYNQLMGSLGWGVVSVDVSGVITFVNRVAQELTGSKEGKLIGKIVENVLEIRNEETESIVMNPLTKVMQENKVMWLGNHAVLKRKDDSKIYIDGSVAPIHSHNKELVGSVLVFRDVSKDKEVQLALLNSLKETKDYKYALDESAMVVITNQEGCITYTNDNFCKISKYSREELIGQDHRIINSGYHSKEFMPELWTTIANGEIWKGEVKNRKKDGSLYWVDTTIVPFLNDKGKPYQYIAIRSEITERKQVEENFLTLANNMSQLVWMADADGSIFWYNQRWFDYSGTTLEEMKGWGWTKVHHPDHLERVVKKIKDYFESGEVWEDSFPLRGADGHYRWFLSRAVPILDAQGKVIRWFGTNTDTTVLKEVEEKLVEKRRELEAKVEELYKSNSELDRFVYSASHDLRAPLKSMLGLIGIVIRSEEPNNTDQMTRLEMLNDSVIKLDGFIEDILNYSRNTRMGVVMEEINFGEILEEIRNGHKFMEGANKLKPLVEIIQKEKFISDKKRITVILNNIISNAIKYRDTSKEESFVSVFVECDSEKAIITIEDNGIGIAEDKQEKVFDMFYRATKLSNGSGLGMYIVKETLEKLDGIITLESSLNKGTKFSIQIPNQTN